MPSKYCSAIGWTHSFSSIFKTDLLLSKSRLAVKLIDLTKKIWSRILIGIYQFPVAVLSNDYFEYEVLLSGSVLRFRVEYQVDRCPWDRAVMSCFIEYDTFFFNLFMDLRSASSSNFQFLLVNIRNHCRPSIRHEVFLSGKKNHFIILWVNSWIRFCKA